MSEVDETKLISLEDACARLQIDASALFVLMAERQLPGCLDSGRWRFDPAALEKWLTQNGGNEGLREHLRVRERGETGQ